MAPSRIMLRAVALLGVLLSAACGPARGGGSSGSDGGQSVDTGAAPTDVGAAVDAGAAGDTPAVAEDRVEVPRDVGVGPTDAGPAVDVVSAPDSGGLGEPAWVNVEVRTDAPCPTPSFCGGDVQGTWDVANGCFEIPVSGQTMLCPNARVTRAAGRARGRVNFGNVIAQRAAEWETAVDVLIPAQCASLVGGCAQLQQFLQSSFPGSTCAPSGGAGDCTCTAQRNGSLRDGDAYTTQNNQIVSSSSGRRWDYCVTGSSLVYRDASQSSTREPGLITLARR